MDKDDFIRQQFLTLREEIKETKDRIYKTMGFGLVVVPVANFLADTYKIDIIVLSLPILVLVVALIFLAENNALMRCGRYIKICIEPEMKGFLGWEQWLETKSCYDTRAVDKYLTYAFYLLFFMYFTGSLFIACRFAYDVYGMLWTSLLGGFYVAIGVWFVIFLLKNIKISTTTSSDICD